LKHGRMPWNGFVVTTWLLGILAVAASLLGLMMHSIQSTLAVTLFGFRANFLHLPLIFLMANVLSRKDVEAMGKWLLILVPPMTVLVFMQFKSEPTAWINVGAGASEGGQIGVAVSGVDKIRPPGVFSYNTGLTSYIALAAAYLFYHFVKGKVYYRWLGWVAGCSLLAMAAFSVSRSSVASLVIVAAMALVAGLLRAEFMAAAIRVTVVCAAFWLVLGTWSAFHEGFSILQARVEEAEGVRVGLVDRFVGGLLEPFHFAASTPMLGHGLGKGTNAGAGLLTGDPDFLLAEEEWSRVVLELGPVLGFAFILLRVLIGVDALRIAIKKIFDGDILPLLLLGASFLSLVRGSFGQPTALGFAVFGIGLCLAAANDENEENAEPKNELFHQAHTAQPCVRGRSAYAEILHGGGLQKLSSKGSSGHA